MLFYNHFQRSFKYPNIFSNSFFFFFENENIKIDFNLSSFKFLPLWDLYNKNKNPLNVFVLLWKAY